MCGGRACAVRVVVTARGTCHAAMPRPYPSAFFLLGGAAFQTIAEAPSKCVEGKGPKHPKRQDGWGRVAKQTHGEFDRGGRRKKGRGGRLIALRAPKGHERHWCASSREGAPRRWRAPLLGRAKRGAARASGPSGRARNLAQCEVMGGQEPRRVPELRLLTPECGSAKNN